MPLALGQPLPLLPLALRGAFFVPVDLEATYTEARQRMLVKQLEATGVTVTLQPAA